MPKRIDVAAIAPVIGTLYPSPFDEPCRTRERRKLGDAARLQQFGVNLLRLPPGAWSSQRHWHTTSDEFVYVISGEITLVTDAGDEILRQGDAAGFKAGDSDGHCLQNRSTRDALILEVGTRIADDVGYYSDIDMVAPAGGNPAVYTHRDGTPYENIRRRGPGTKVDQNWPDRERLRGAACLPILARHRAAPFTPVVKGRGKIRSMPICVRKAVPEDARKIATLVEHYWRFEEIAGFDLERTTGLLANVLEESGRGAVWLASEGLITVGYLALALVFSIEGGGLIGEIDELYVLESYRGHGAGTRLLEAAESYAIKAGCHRIGLQISRRNAITQAFYSGRGYLPRSGYDLLQKSLGNPQQI